MKFQTFDSLAFLCLLIFCSLSHTSYAHSDHVPKSYSVESIKHAQGSQKGDKVEGVHHLKRYLNRFGYLDERFLNNHEVDDDKFDENSEIALKTFQLNFNLKPTGILDNETVLLMAKPQCGVPDVHDGSTRMNSAGNYSIKYALFPGKPKWPLSQILLKWAVHPGTPKDVIGPILEHSFPQWAAITPFFYQFIKKNVTATDIQRSFSDTGFSDTTLATASPPTIGRITFNSRVKWAFGAVEGAYDIGTVSLHELGHVLGLAHSSIEEAVMWPFVDIGTKEEYLHDDDILGMKTLYNMDR